MFGLFKSPPFRDAVLGELSRSRGYWRGSLTLGGGTRVPLVLSGSRAQPDAQAVSLALAVPDSFASWRSSIETVLFEHLAPYAEAIAAWEEPSPAEPLLIISTPSQVWPLVSFLFVSVTPLGGVLTTEIGLRVVWDEEHTLGARFQAGKFLELCGSVLSP